VTPSFTINITNTRLLNWMATIKTSYSNIQFRIFENFWASQIDSKFWLLEELKKIEIEKGNVYIFGGWYGTLGGLIIDNLQVNDVFSIDIDPSCASIGKVLNPDVKFITQNMREKFNLNNPCLLVNTSTEHISQEIFQEWYDTLPKNVPIVLQGNNFHQCSEHIRCANSLQEFIDMNKLDEVILSGQLDCKDFTRFMQIGYKK
jgi:hypothetical protein